MILLGIILLVLGLGLGTAAFLGVRDETGTIALDALGFTRAASPLELLVIGAIAMLLFALGWAVVSAAARRRARVRRDERESERIADIERSIESERAENEDRWERAAMRDEDLRRREDELAARGRQLDAREKEVHRLEAAYREQVRPSVADVVTGRAEGRVSEGTAEWADSSAEGSRASRPDPDDLPSNGGHRSVRERTDGDPTT